MIMAFKYNTNTSFQPTFYAPTRNTKSDWKTLDGTPVEPMKFDDMKSAKISMIE